MPKSETRPVVAGTHASCMQPAVAVEWQLPVDVAVAVAVAVAVSIKLRYRVELHWCLLHCSAALAVAVTAAQLQPFYVALTALVDDVAVAVAAATIAADCESICEQM